MVRTSLFALLTLSAAAAAAAPGRVVVVQGTAAVTRPSGDMLDLNTGDVVDQGDVVESGKDSYVRVMMQDGSVLDLGGNTRVVIRKYAGKPGRKVSIKLWVGRLWARVMSAVSDEDSYVVSGGNAVVGIRGTEIILDARTDGSADVTVLSGRISLTSMVGDAAADIGAMERGSVDADGKISKARLSGQDVSDLRKQGKPVPRLDERGKMKRLESVRERLQIEITPTPEPIELPDEGDDSDDGLDDLDQLDDDPADPLLDLDPDAFGGGSGVEETTKVIGDVEVLP